MPINTEPPTDRSTVAHSSCPTDLAAVLAAVTSAAAELAATIAGRSVSAAPPVAAAPAPAVNGGGDVADALDTCAHDLFVGRLAGASVRAVVSEEALDVIEIDESGEFLVAIDPLDGSSNIEIDAPLGTIFSVRRHDATQRDLVTQFLEAGRNIVAAGYVLYSSTTVLVMSTGAGVSMYGLDPATGAFRLAADDLRLPIHGREFAINVSNYRHWDPFVCNYIDDLIAGTDGAGGVDYNMRWIAALVAECHRILVRGGIFLYPGDARGGYRDGRLRLLYEAHPIAFLIEQAGGMAIDGVTPVLDKRAVGLHDRTPFVFGGIGEIRRFESYRDARPFIGERAPLFARRGLFRI